MYLRSISLITAAISVLTLIPHSLSCVSSDAAPILTDSGIDYTETVGTILNPGAGYTQTIWPVCKPESTPTYSPSGGLVLFFIDIGAFSSGANGYTDDDGTYHEGTDYDLDDAFFSSWKTTFENCRKNGCMIALRFRYDVNGKADPEPASFDQVLKHIRQIKDSGLLEEYKDIIAFVESGFVGKWGEQHGGKYTSVRYKAQLLDAMLDAVPDPIPVTVRTPDIFAEWAGISRSELADYVCEPGSTASRVGMYDDGYMGSDSDLGTYADREAETTWLGNQSLHSYFGGEFSGNIDFAKQYDTYLPENAIPEMYKTHLSYINSNIFSLYNDYTFGADCDADNVDNSAYYGQSVYRFIRDHLGYRFVLRNSGLSPEVPQGGQLDLDFTVENTGFANPIPDTNVSFLLERDGNYMRAFSDISANDWLSRTSSEEHISLHIPDALLPGKWNIYVKVDMGDNTIGQMDMRSVRFANNDIWDPSLGANYLGSFTVIEAPEGSVPTFDGNYFLPVEREVISEQQQMYLEMYTVKGHVTADGLISSPYEWTDDMVIGRNGDNTVSMTADDEYIYVMGHLPDGASAPVYNLRLTRADGESYWIYFQSSGFVYFNHNDGKYDGASCKWNGDTVEFRIPLSLMGLSSGTELEKIRLFLQDSGNNWEVLGEVNSSPCSVPHSFTVYSAKNRLLLKDFTGTSAFNYMSIVSSLDEPEIQWMHNGEVIENDGEDHIYDGNILQFLRPETGVYSVRLTAPDGSSTVVDIAEVVGVVTMPEGDVNLDFTRNIADLVSLQAYILRRGVFVSPEKADINLDGTVDIFDVIMLRKLIAE